MPFSLNGCSLSSGCSSIEQKAAASYGLNRIKSYQVQLMSPDVTCPLDSCVPTFVRASEESSCLRESNSSKESCCIHESKEQRSARLQNNARHAKPGGCKIMLHTMHKDTRGKVLQRTHPVQGHSMTPEHTVLFQSVQLVLGFL